MKSRVASVAQLLFVDLAGSVVYFPVWWYTKGLQKVIDASATAVWYRVREYALVIWIKNLFVPMYGEYSFWGRAISLMMRFVVLIYRIVALVIEIGVYFIGIAIWVFLPPVSLYLAIQGGILTLIHQDRIGL
jgi:hypothetical protein